MGKQAPCYHDHRDFGNIVCTVEVAPGSWNLKGSHRYREGRASEFREFPINKKGRCDLSIYIWIQTETLGIG